MAAHKRERVVKAARAVIHRRGFERTSLADIAREAGVPLGNLYYYFKRKDHILSAIAQDCCAAFSTRTTAWEQEYPLAKDRILAFLSLAVELRTEMAAFGCPVGSLLQELAKESDADTGTTGRRESRMMLAVQVSWLEAQFRSAGYSDPRALALQMVGRLQGAILLANALGEPPILDHEIDQLRLWISQLSP